MDDRGLDRLFRRVVNQEPYDDAECLSAETALRYHGGELDPEDVAAIQRHLAGCPACKLALTRIEDAARWFACHEGELRDKTMARMAEALAAKAPCPSRILLRDLVKNRLPDSSEGRDVARMLREHAENCSRCRAVLADEAARLKSGRHIDLAGLGRTVVEGLQREIEAALRSLEALVGAGAKRAVPAVAHRDVVAERVAVPVYSADERLELTRTGSPRVVVFDVIRLSIEAGGRLVLDLVAPPDSAALLAGTRYELRATIRHDNGELRLPAGDLQDDGRVTTIVNLGSQVAPASISVRALVMRLVAKGS